MPDSIERSAANKGQGEDQSKSQGKHPGKDLGASVLDQASEWLVKLWSGIATHEDYQACERWRAAHADHERAWQRLQAIDRKLEIVPRSVAQKALKKPSSSLMSRRRTLKGFAVLLTGGAATYGIGRTGAWQAYAADYRTGTGESRTIVLADSTQVILNTASAIDVRFDTQQRRIELHSGEIMVTTAHDPAAVARPFSVTTPHGTVRALGTRFTVRDTNDATAHVVVLEGAVLIQPRDHIAEPLRLEAGQQMSFSGTGGLGASPADESASAWTRGSLMVERVRLDAFIEELSRYRPGVLRCDPSAAHYLLTGVYPLTDTDRILASIEKALPIKVIYRNRYWVTVTART